MGHTILTSHQSAVLEQAKIDDEITRWYYFTGGTALSEFYLHHRLSEDLDFFTRSQVNDAKIDAIIDHIRLPLEITNVDKHHISGLFMYTLTFADGGVLKVDFNEYDFPVVEQGILFGKLRIDSLYDIAVNKLYTIMGRGKIRDFIDLYFCLEKEGYYLEQLLSRVTDKFGISISDLEIVRHFTKVTDLTDYPTMIVPFNKQKMIDFFLAEAKKLEPKIFK